MYVHCKPDFRTSRLIANAEHLKLSGNAVLNNILVGHAKNCENLMKFLAIAMQKMKSNE